MRDITAESFEQVADGAWRLPVLFERENRTLLGLLAAPGVWPATGARLGAGRMNGELLIHAEVVPQLVEVFRARWSGPAPRLRRREFVRGPHSTDSPGSAAGPEPDALLTVLLAVGPEPGEVELLPRNGSRTVPCDLQPGNALVFDASWRAQARGDGRTDLVAAFGDRPDGREER